jgi:hypothetical protein
LSHYLNVETQITDAKALYRALQRVTLRGTNKCATTDQIEVHKKAAHLFGYHGDQRADVANIIIRRQYVGSASNDIGFVKGKDGRYKAIISQFDKKYYNQKWLEKLFTFYGVERAKMELEKRRMKFKEFVDENDPQKRPRLMVQV